jgi:Na+/alanine symporter
LISFNLAHFHFVSHHFASVSLWHFKYVAKFVWLPGSVEVEISIDSGRDCLIASAASLAGTGKIAGCSEAVRFCGHISQA